MFGISGVLSLVKNPFATAQNNAEILLARRRPGLPRAIAGMAGRGTPGPNKLQATARRGGSEIALQVIYNN